MYLDTFFFSLSQVEGGCSWYPMMPRTLLELSRISWFKASTMARLKNPAPGCCATVTQLPRPLASVCLRSTFRFPGKDAMDAVCCVSQSLDQGIMFQTPRYLEPNWGIAE